MADIELLSVVALLAEMPERGLRRRQVGTVVENLAPDVFEVEFSDDRGRAYGISGPPLRQLMQLHHEPSHQAA